MALLALRRNVVDSMEVFGAEGHRLRLDEIVVDERSRLVGRTLQEVSGDAVPVLLRRGSELLRAPEPDLRIEPGDELVVLVDPEDRPAIETA
jgi:Trk K+ transport system NAD-binding subunit